MDLGLIGPGGMGADMVRCLLLNRHRIVAYNRTAEKTRETE
jgi:3-hydroxyisobutyrate dehydrogenase-like beta-hydroxyacid dehydrogenase